MSRTETALKEEKGSDQDQDKLLPNQLNRRDDEETNQDDAALHDDEDGEFRAFMETMDEGFHMGNNSESESSYSSKDASLKDKLDRLTKPRDYPLFLAEKAAEFIEATLDDLSKPLDPVFNLARPVTNGNVPKRERLVILGSGWGAASLLKDIDSDLYEVTVVSPRNYFLFTPMLAGASVGTVQLRSICEPIQEINPKSKYIEAAATHIDPSRKRITCQTLDKMRNNDDEIEEFEVQYDKLIVSIGAQTNTFGIPGIREYCSFLRHVEDARRVRTEIIRCFEQASPPSLTDFERQERLTFCIIGAGPTGIEFAAELRDFVEQDGPKYYPKLIQHVSIKVIEASSTVLAPFDKSLQDEAIRQLRRPVKLSDPTIQLPQQIRLTDLILDSSVEKVDERSIYLKNGTVIPYGLAVWAAGNGPLPLTLQLIETLGVEQEKEQAIARGRLAIDPWMRVLGTKGSILSLGDCSCITSSPTPLPVTAQVASQQGEYLANLLNRKFEFSPNVGADGIFPPPTRVAQQTESSLADIITNYATNTTEFAKPFQFLNLGILAYTGGGTALAQVTPIPDESPIKGTGPLANAVWRGVYLSKQFSWRNRLLVMNDWTKRRLFGRDIWRL